MAKERRSPRGDREVIVTGTLREEPDLELLAQALVTIAMQRQHRDSSAAAKATVAETELVPSPIEVNETGCDLAVWAKAASTTSKRLVSPLGRRWKHVQAVAARAMLLSQDLVADERHALVASAWLHDIGYADELVVTGLHPLDGARYLQDEGWPAVVVSLVAYHTGAAAEAKQRDLLDELLEFDVPPPELLDLLTTADMVTGPDGAWVRANDRVQEVLHRYSPQHPVHRAVTRSAPRLIAAVTRVEERLDYPVQPPLGQPRRRR
jgi:hypothetical protein